MYTELWLEEPEGRRPLGKCGINGKTNIKMDLRKIHWKNVGFMCLKIWTSGWWGENSNDTLGSIKDGEIS
jgi:hypothetical protein